VFYAGKEYRSSLAIKTCINIWSWDYFVQTDFRVNGISILRYDSLIKNSCISSNKHLEQWLEVNCKHYSCVSVGIVNESYYFCVISLQRGKSSLGFTRTHKRWSDSNWCDPDCIVLCKKKGFVISSSSLFSFLIFKLKNLIICIQ